MPNLWVFGTSRQSLPYHLGAYKCPAMVNLAVIRVIKLFDCLRKLGARFSQRLAEFHFANSCLLWLPRGVEN